MGDMTNSLVASSWFVDLVRRAWLEPVRRTDLQDANIPDDFDEDEVWDALTAIRYAQAYRSPKGLHTVDGISDNWHTVPESLQRTLHELGRKTQVGSPLDTLARERSGRSFITQQYIEEMLCNLSFDGFDIEYEDARSVLLGERPVACAAEAIACNYHDIMQSLETYSDTPFNQGLLEDLYGRLLDGADTGNEEQRFYEGGLVPRSPLEEHYASGASPEIIDSVSLQMPIDVAAGLACDPPRHPIMASMLVNCQFWRAPIFPSCNNLMGCIASRLYLVQQGYPVFRYVPKIRILDKWKQGSYRQEVPCSYEEALACAEDSMDWTLYYDTVMKLMLREVHAMERSLVLRAATDREAIEGIARVPYLTHRQQEVLRQAVLRPEHVFRIAEHQKHYGVAYSTARSDFEKLVELGFLSRNIEGQAYTYQAVHNLRAVLK